MTDYERRYVEIINKDGKFIVLKRNERDFVIATKEFSERNEAEKYAKDYLEMQKAAFLELERHHKTRKGVGLDYLRMPNLKPERIRQA